MQDIFSKGEPKGDFVYKTNQAESPLIMIFEFFDL
jgi:hypothetical protein